MAETKKVDRSALDFKVKGLRLYPLGGLGEIGMNCMVLETENDMVLIDCGLIFSDQEVFGIGYVVPDFSYVLSKKEKLRAIVLTHGHEDHIGAVPYAVRSGLNAPIYGTAFTQMLVKEKLSELGLESRVDLHTIKPGVLFKCGEFVFDSVAVNHSIIDAVALLIQTPVGKILHTGDFRIDPEPFYGKVLDLGFFEKAGDHGVLLLLSDSTNVERHEHSLSEKRVYQSFEALFEQAEGLTVVGMFASNVGRIGQILELANKQGKKVVLAGRSMERNAHFSRELGYLKDAAQVLIDLSEVNQYNRSEVIVVSTGSQAELGSTLQRLSVGEHKLLALEPGDRVIMSSRSIPGNERLIGRMINKLFKQGADVLYEAMHEVHASGHATRPELKQILELVKPKFFIPIHGEYRHLVHHGDLAVEVGISPENVLIAESGDVLQIEPDSMECLGHIEETRVFSESREGQEVSKQILRDRRHLGEKGVAFAVLIRSRESRHVVAEPKVVAKGLVHESIEGFMLEEAVSAVKRVIRDYDTYLSEGLYTFDLEENVRIELRRFFNQNIGKKPTVVVVVLDL